ncbi:hypothetical protein Q31a_53570 [Aureliella helgolandensis]|uniref:Uncharacterized protein n=1 Tax=Aureliella helgolandensis TaxID=2527968 RepID=A0A518GEJ5_9BACT|nr:hypothetical protein Q31a_53570 [Aureliella helgolandensis]
MAGKQLGSICDATFSAEASEEIAEMSKARGAEIRPQGEAGHLESVEDMGSLMHVPGECRSGLRPNTLSLRPCPMSRPLVRPPTAEFLLG